MDEKHHLRSRGVEVPSLPNNTARPPEERKHSSDEWRRGYRLAVIDITALAGSWLRQAEPDPDVRDAVQQCADELLVLVHRLDTQLKGVCSCGPHERCSGCKIGGLR
jgi:hypothetical protein